MFIKDSMQIEVAVLYLKVSGTSSIRFSTARN